MIHISSCVFGKKSIHSDQAYNPVNTETTDDIKKSKNDGLVIYCGRDSIFYDTKLGFIRSSNTDAYYCLREKAFQGDTTACRQIASIIPLMRNPFSVYDKNLRGEILFKAVLEKLNNFEFVPGPNGEMDVFTYYGSYARIMYQMIESIDGVSPDIYLPNNYPKRFATELSGIEPFSPEYIQKSGRIKWEIFKESYEKGLIKFKAFGQE